MTREEKLKLLEEWKQSHDALDAQFDALGKCFDGVTGSFFNSAWNTFSNYTKLVSVLLGDKWETVDWFAMECDFGRKPKEAGMFDINETRMIATFDDLLWLIEVCK